MDLADGYLSILNNTPSLLLSRGVEREKIIWAEYPVRVAQARHLHSLNPSNNLCEVAIIPVWRQGKEDQVCTPQSESHAW